MLSFIWEVTLYDLLGGDVIICGCEVDHYDLLWCKEDEDEGGSENSSLILIIQADTDSINNQLPMYFLSQNCQIHFMLQMEIIGKLLSFAGWRLVCSAAAAAVGQNTFSTLGSQKWPPHTYPLFASYLQNTKFKMCRKQIFPSCLELKIMGSGFGRKYLKNPTLPLLQQRWEGRRGKFWVRQTIPLFSHPQSGKIHLRFRRQNWDQMFKCWQLRVERPDGISVGNWAASEWTFPCYGILWNGLSAHKPCSRSHILYVYILVNCDDK